MTDRSLIDEALTAALADALHKHWLDSIEKADGQVFAVCTCGAWVLVEYEPPPGDPVMAFSRHCAEGAVLDGMTIVPAGLLAQYRSEAVWKALENDPDFRAAMAQAEADMEAGNVKRVEIVPTAEIERLREIEARFAPDPGAGFTSDDDDEEVEA